MSAPGQPQRQAFPQWAAITVLPLSFTAVPYSPHMKRVSILQWRSICLVSKRMTLAALELIVAQASESSQSQTDPPVPSPVSGPSSLWSVLNSLVGRRTYVNSLKWSEKQNQICKGRSLPSLCFYLWFFSSFSFFIVYCGRGGFLRPCVALTVPEVSL